MRKQKKIMKQKLVMDKIKSESQHLQYKIEDKLDKVKKDEKTMEQLYKDAKQVIVSKNGSFDYKTVVEEIDSLIKKENKKVVLIAQNKAMERGITMLELLKQKNVGKPFSSMIRLETKDYQPCLYIIINF